MESNRHNLAAKGSGCMRTQHTPEVHEVKVRQRLAN